jgi:hypothetical protein
VAVSFIGGGKASSKLTYGLYSLLAVLSLSPTASVSLVSCFCFNKELLTALCSVDKEKGFGLLNAFAWSIYDFGLCNAFFSSANGFGLVNVFADDAVKWPAAVPGTLDFSHMEVFEGMNYLF